MTEQPKSAPQNIQGIESKLRTFKNQFKDLKKVHTEVQETINNIKKNVKKAAKPAWYKVFTSKLKPHQIKHVMDKLSQTISPAIEKFDNSISTAKSSYEDRLADLLKSSSAGSEKIQDHKELRKDYTLELRIAFRELNSSLTKGNTSKQILAWADQARKIVKGKTVHDIVVKKGLKGGKYKEHLAQIRRETGR